MVGMVQVKLVTLAEIKVGFKTELVHVIAAPEAFVTVQAITPVGWCPPEPVTTAVKFMVPPN